MSNHSVDFQAVAAPDGGGFRKLNGNSGRLVLHKNEVRVGQHPRLNACPAAYEDRIPHPVGHEIVIAIPTCLQNGHLFGDGKRVGGGCRRTKGVGRLLGMPLRRPRRQQETSHYDQTGRSPRSAVRPVSPLDHSAEQSNGVRDNDLLVPGSPGGGSIARSNKPVLRKVLNT